MNGNMLVLKNLSLYMTSKSLCPECVLYASILLVIVLFRFNYHCSSIQ